MEEKKEKQNLPVQEDVAKDKVMKRVKEVINGNNALYWGAKRVVDMGMQFPEGLFQVLLEGWLLQEVGSQLYRLREFWPQAYFDVMNEAALMFWDRLHRTV